MTCIPVSSNNCKLELRILKLTFSVFFFFHSLIWYIFQAYGYHIMSNIDGKKQHNSLWLQCFQWCEQMSKSSYFLLNFGVWCHCFQAIHNNWDKSRNFYVVVVGGGGGVQTHCPAKREGMEGHSCPCRRGGNLCVCKTKEEAHARGVPSPIHPGKMFPVTWVIKTCVCVLGLQSGTCVFGFTIIEGHVCSWLYNQEHVCPELHNHSGTCLFLVSKSGDIILSFITSDMIVLGLLHNQGRVCPKLHNQGRVCCWASQSGKCVSWVFTP